MKKRVTYKSSGVDIHKANAFVDGIKFAMKATMDQSVLKRKGSFGALYALGQKNCKDPVLVSSTDGVGTKLLIAQAVNKHDTVGIDLVAMNVNDILCVGARPLFFLDYIACGKLDPEVLKSVVKGIAKGCRMSGCSLIGGETAEMPGMYKKNEYDLAGFAVGVVEKKNIIDGTGIQEGDHVIGVPSSGLHSNGFSMVRKVFSSAEQRSLAKVLLRPTRIYAKEVLSVTSHFPVKGIAHITGGAFYEKLTKILPSGLCFSIDRKSWRVPSIFRLLQEKGNIEDAEMYRTFNMGIGLVFVVDSKYGVELQQMLKGQGTQSHKIGFVVRDKRKIIL